MTTQFHDQKSDERIEQLRRREEEELAKMLAGKYGVEYTDLTSKSIDTDALQLVPEQEAHDSEVAAFRKIGKRLFVAMRAPERANSLQTIANLERLGYQVRRFMVSQASLLHAWDRYRDLSMATETEAGVLTISNDAIQKMLSELKSVKDVSDHVHENIGSKDTHRISRVLEIIMAGALSLGASDVHLEPEEAYVRMRYRLDGVLNELLTFDHTTYGMIASRIKLLSGLKLNIKNAAQDGRFSIVVNQKEIEIRTSILPGNYAETVVMRVLDPTTIGLSLEKLGFDKYLMEIFLKEIERPNGMILNTGPTGSGKTTTLYAFLRAVHKPGVKIVTIEDPIEYHLPGIVQTQVSKNYSFAQGLRSTLRQDPDIIMVGEIRDGEVASTAVHAALTGHLVFSTLHTNNAAGTFPRLIDMGIQAEILGSSVNIAMAQRLVRRLCEHCRETAPIEGKNKENVERMLKNIPHPEDLPENRTMMWVPKGCERCGGIGYKGRIGIVEAIFMDEEMEKTVRATSSEREIWRASARQQIRRMPQDGIVKVLRGITSIDEVERTVNIEEEIGGDA
ncbi:type II/IV secretion system protein [Candidatus Kaiserbacteria bacterium]|nr:type II/IV secretion system protein [Candidatus Kaiserbacteria bacterium]